MNFNESILFLFVHRISSFFAPFLSYLDHFTIRDIDNIQPIPQRGDRYSYSLHIHPPFSWNNTRGNSIDDAPLTSFIRPKNQPRPEEKATSISTLVSIILLFRGGCCRWYKAHTISGDDPEGGLEETSHSYANEGRNGGESSRLVDKGAPVRRRDWTEGDGVDIRCGASRGRAWRRNIGEEGWRDSLGG